MPKRKPRKRTTVAEERVLGKRRAPVWEKALAYVLAGHSLREAADEYGLPVSTLYTVAREDRWCEQRGQVDEEVRKRLTEELVERRLAKARDVEFAAEGIAERHESIVSRAQLMLVKIEDEIEIAMADGSLSGSRKGKMGAIRVAQSMLRSIAETSEKLNATSTRAHDTRRKVHRLDDDGGGRGEDLLDSVLRRMEESGEIAAPIAVQTGAGHGRSEGDVEGGNAAGGAPGS